MMFWLALGIGLIAWPNRPPTACGQDRWTPQRCSCCGPAGDVEDDGGWSESEWVDADAYLQTVEPRHADWCYKVMPDGLLYPSYLAGVKESRMSGTVIRESHLGWLLDVALGGRVGILRYGTEDPIWPEGWQIDIEGAAFPRLDLENNWDMVAADFRFGVPVTYGIGPIRTKLAYYHLSSHLGDEYMIRYPGTEAERLNYSRETLVLGVSWYPQATCRLYAETGWAFHTDGGSEPWELQFGMETSTLEPCDIGGGPFLAVNGHLREEVDFGGNVVVQTGWQWQGMTGARFRAGVHYFNGKSNQFQFFDESEEQLGLGLWYDF